VGSSITFRQAIALLVPPRCAVCATPCAATEVLCAGCEAGLRASQPIRLAVPGLDLTLAAAPYEGVARELVRALKFDARIALTRRAARAIADALEPSLGEIPRPLDGPRSPCAVVPVPAAPSRLLRRGFDPAEAIASALAADLGLPLRPCLCRSDGPRQVGRRRRARLSDPPQVRLVSEAPQRAIVVDDVLTTGSTLGVCARALRAGGASGVIGAAFARSL
jgi:ComF family protein